MIYYQGKNQEIINSNFYHQLLINTMKLIQISILISHAGSQTSHQLFA
jgi:hypothetical protein